MSEFNPPDPTTNFGEDLEYATARYDELQSHEQSRKHQLIDEIFEREPDEYNIVRISSDEIPEIQAELSSLGLIAQEPTEADVSSGRNRARGLFMTGRAFEFLGDREANPFTPVAVIYSQTAAAKAPRKVVSWGMSFEKADIYIKPEVITGGGGDFYDWTGGDNRKSRDTVEGQKIDGSSKKAIEEYAARFESQLPSLEFAALNVVLTDEGAICSVDHGVHRVAAAKLRGEPLGFSSMVLYDMRSKTISDEPV